MKTIKNKFVEILDEKNILIEKQIVAIDALNN